MATLGVHTFAAAPKWDLATMRKLQPALQRHGVGAIEIPLLDPAAIDVAGTRAFFEESGMAPVCSLGLPGALDPIDDPEPALSFLRPALKVTRDIGAPALSGVTYGTIGRTSGAPVTAAETSGMCRFLERAAGLAREAGLRLGIEPCNRYETHLMNTGARARRICEAVGAENLFIHLDTYHMNIEERSFLDGFRDCGPFLGYVHLSESNRGTPGQGMVDWDAVYRGLVEAGFDGITTLESMNHVHPAIASGLAIWRPVAENPDDVIESGLPYLHHRAAAAGFAYT